MKRVLAVVSLFVVLAVGSAYAAETKWAVRVYGSDNTVHLSGGIVNASGGYAGIGVAQNEGTPFSASGMGGIVYAGSMNDVDGKLYSMVSKPAFSTWTVYVAASAAYTKARMRISIGTASSANALSATVGGQPVRYAVRINDVFQAYLPILPSYTPSGTELWYKDVGTVKGDLTAGPAGYKVTLTQEWDAVPVPEPSSFLALGSGLLGLAGFVIQRRRRP